MNTFKRADQVKVGDVIVLDCGYGAHSYDQNCTVRAVIRSNSLFHKDGDPYQLWFTVTLPNGEPMHTHNFDQETLISVP